MSNIKKKSRMSYMRDNKYLDNGSGIEHNMKNFPQIIRHGKENMKNIIPTLHKYLINKCFLKQTQSRKT